MMLQRPGGTSVVKVQSTVGQSTAANQELCEGSLLLSVNVNLPGVFIQL